MRLHRFYMSLPLGEEVVVNDVSTIKQWSNVFRYKKGDLVVLFNGSGEDRTYSIENLSPKACGLKFISKEKSVLIGKRVSLYLSLIKKDLFELVVQKATEIGIYSITPVISERSTRKDLNHERLIKIATEAAEQCGRGDIPDILPAIELSSALKGLEHGYNKYFLQKDGQDFIEKREGLSSDSSLLFFVGPEGGWAESEIKLFEENNFKALSLGQTTLRAETAAIVGAALMLQN
ncbi:MAG: rRNA ((1498)-N(3))-methyltransferase [Candidatus Nomurabacteria bacterium]|nr:rRNA ((1498)-N(3))-methyltransferase [Candidatus Nomurabacteria bacterium]